MIKHMVFQTDDNELPQEAFSPHDYVEDLEIAEERSTSSTSPEPSNNTPGSHRNIDKRLILSVLALVLVTAGVVGGLLFLQKPAAHTPTSIVVNTQSLDNGTLNKLTPSSDGTQRQQLTISPDTIFKSNVTVQGSTSLAKDLEVGGTANIQGATTLRDALVVGRSVSVGNNLTVNGSITASSLSVASITISNINISGDLAFAGHIVPTGNLPAVRASSAAGGGNATISGNDTAGTVTITTGGGSLIAGELAVINFHSPFNTTPKVQLTPLNLAASNLPYYVTHSAGFFTVDAGAAPAANTTYIFDYFVTQ